MDLYLFATRALTGERLAKGLFINQEMLRFALSFSALRVCELIR
jgi:hypothetical protein